LSLTVNSIFEIFTLSNVLSSTITTIPFSVFVKLTDNTPILSLTLDKSILKSILFDSTLNVKVLIILKMSMFSDFYMKLIY